jgi:hypothetical protein
MRWGRRDEHLEGTVDQKLNELVKVDEDLEMGEAA